MVQLQGERRWVSDRRQENKVKWTLRGRILKSSEYVVNVKDGQNI